MYNANTNTQVTLSNSRSKAFRFKICFKGKVPFVFLKSDFLVYTVYGKEE